jgi:hypothetical protein
VPSGQPPALKAWFYPGDNYGRQFVYPKGEAAVISEAARENVPVEGAAVAETASALKEPAPVVTDQPATTASDQSVTTETKTSESVSSEPTETAVIEQPKTDETTTTTTTEVTTEDQTAQPQPQPTPTPINDQPTTSSDQSTTTLPSTASDWPLVGLIGLCSVVGAFALRMFTRSLS